MADQHPRARVVVEREMLRDNGLLMQQGQVAGLSMLSRQLLGLRRAGVERIAVAADCDLHERVRSLLARVTPAVPDVDIIDIAEPVDRSGAGTLVIPVDLVIDPRALVRLLETAEERGCSVVCVDRFPDGYAETEKSPFVHGAPGGDEGMVLEGASGEDGWHDIGVALERDAGEGVGCAQGRLQLTVGRYQWHRVRAEADAEAATTKILLAAIKPTDGIYAKLNRRVSLQISRHLLPTLVTPNQVTLFTLVCSLVAGLVMAGGTYASFVLGGLLAWFASMLDGVDGELARARFQTTALGHWLEMACDYTFYIAVIVGHGVGLYRADSDRVWLTLAAIGAVGVVLCFLAVARAKRAYAHAEPGGDYYVAFQRTTSANGSNPVYFFTRYVTFLATRAAFPYYIVLFAVLGWSKAMFFFVLAGTQLSWPLTLYAGRLKMSLAPVAPEPALRASIATDPAHARPALDES